MMLESVRMDGVVVIGEGEKDEAPMLYNGEHIGDGSPPEVDIAVDPLEGTRLCALGMPSALAVISLAPRGTMFNPGPIVYMEKLAGGPEIADLLDLDRPLGETVGLVAERKGIDVRDVMVVVLDRPRHEEGIKAIRDAGARARLITDGDVSAALMAVDDDTSVDLLWGIGGTPEGVLAASGIKSIGGQLVGRLWPRDDGERQAALDAGYDLDRILTVDDLVAGDDVLLLGHRRDRRRRPGGRALRGPRRARHDGVDRHALALGDGAAHQRPAQPPQAARDHRRTAVRLDPARAKRPTRDSARSRRASERRNPCVTMTWIRDCVCVYTKRERREAIIG